MNLFLLYLLLFKAVITSFSGMASLAMPYVVLLLIVIIRPQGIYGWKINDRV